jgi:NodT family efflux transporter outer membrane factor (OMF) lipoprotein
MKLAALACASMACHVGPDFVRPRPPAVARYTAAGVSGTIAAGGVAQVVHAGEALPGEWWRLFRSAPLDGVVRAALADNASLDASRASLRRSEALMRAGYGVFWPQVDAKVGATRERFSPAQFGGTGASNEFNLYTLGGTVSYAFDWWGGQRRTVEGLRAQVDAQCYQLAAARLTVTGNAVDAAIARAAYAEEIAVTEALIASQAQQIEIARAQERGGTGTEAAVLALETQRANTIATLPPIRQQETQAEDLLAQLVGRMPADWRPPAIGLDDLAVPADLPVSLPADLVRQRPDVLIAEANLHVASAQIGVATAAMLPGLSLSGSIGSTATTLGSIFEFKSFVWTLGASVLAPIFHGGQLWNQRKAAIEAFHQALAQYRQTVLTAVGDVANQLEALAHDAEEVDARAHALAAATEARELVRVNFAAGLAGYLDVLNADTQYEQARLGDVQARAARLQDTVALFVALGGGWWETGTRECAAGEFHTLPVNAR